VFWDRLNNAMAPNLSVLGAFVKDMILNKLQNTLIISGQNCSLDLWCAHACKNLTRLD
jgi:hypothetical protein